jgi:hypothetical protein
MSLVPAHNIHEIMSRQVTKWGRVSLSELPPGDIPGLIEQCDRTTVEVTVQTSRCSVQCELFIVECVVECVVCSADFFETGNLKFILLSDYLSGFVWISNSTFN